MQFPAIPGCSLLLILAGGPSPILDERPWCSSPPFLAAICCCCLLVVPCKAWVRARVAVPGWGLSRQLWWVLLLVWDGWLSSVCVLGGQRGRSRACRPLYGVLGSCICAGPGRESLLCVRLRVRVVGCPSPNLAEGSRCSSSPFLAGVCCWR